MLYLIGTDEAGYGPNLGPLVISATVWLAPDACRDADWYELLSGVVSRHGRPQRRPSQVPIADSKSLYKPGGTLQNLECGVLTALRAIGLRPAHWREAWAALAPQNSADVDRDPWYRDFELAWPLAHDSDSLDRLAETFLQGLQQASVRLLAMRSVVVSPEQFNGRLDRLGNKATVLSTVTMELIKAVLPPADGQAVLVVCDKHGGRQRYADLLQATFPDYLVEIFGESPARSVYRWGPATRRVEFRFLEKAERFLPVALASMMSKYLRELAMLAWNAFWQRQVPGLRATAGYPLDAVRFKKEIEGCQQGLGIPDARVWRNR